MFAVLDSKVQTWSSHYLDGQTLENVKDLTIHLKRFATLCRCQL